jgi:hypothetical protein
VSVADPEYGCADTGTCVECFLPNAEATCDTAGECAIAQCAARRGNCDGDVSNGCETNLNEDVDHCGECDEPCEVLAHARVFCGGANCKVLTCDSGWGNCDGRDTNGCETNLLATDAHCGQCDSPCSDDSYCSDGDCV